MYPTLHHGDYLFLNKINYRFHSIKRGDIVVIKMGKSRYIKRVIGLPGETIQAIDGKVYINGKYLEESYLSKDIITLDFNLEEISGNYQIPDDEYFVMGDNRPNSKDSRVFKAVERKKIIGKTTIVLFPFTRFDKKLK